MSEEWRERLGVLADKAALNMGSRQVEFGVQLHSGKPFCLLFACFKNGILGDFPGGPVVKTLH